MFSFFYLKVGPFQKWFSEQVSKQKATKGVFLVKNQPSVCTFEKILTLIYCCAVTFTDIKPITGNMNTGRSAVAAIGSASVIQNTAMMMMAYAHSDS